MTTAIIGTVTIMATVAITIMVIEVAPFVERIFAIIAVATSVIEIFTIVGKGVELWTETAANVLSVD